MKFTLSWLKSHLDTKASIDEIVAALDKIGLEVENTYKPDEKIRKFRIAKVVKAEKHPNADKLKVLSVDDGQGKLIQIICGAPNAKAGLLGVMALPGDYIPGLGSKLSVGNIRGVESFGMMCSEKELELSDEHEGIIELPNDAPVGEIFADYANLDDPVIEINLTPNRPDCTGVRGIARDLAAANIGTLKENPVDKTRGSFPCPVKVSFDFGDTDSLCPAFAVRMIKGVKNRNSPKWLQNRLNSIGLRPRNALVDITNFITFDRGRPLHVFDASKIVGNLVVRRGRKGESILALDGKEYTVDENTCVIADDNGVESLSGIMGGKHTGCNEDTVDVVIESALWKSLNIAQTGRRLRIMSDARYRFERGVDPEFMIPGLELATKLILDICGGSPSEMSVTGEKYAFEKNIDFPISEVKRLTGLDVLPAEAKENLTQLGFSVFGSTDEVRVSVPSWRPDIHGKADLVEEIIRVTGLEKTPSTPLPRLKNVGQKVLTWEQITRNKARRSLATLGLKESVTWSFISHKLAKSFGGGGPELELANPISPDLSDMRPSLIPGLLMASQRNADKGYRDIGIFEVGQAFKSDTPSGQFMVSAGLRRGTAVLSGSGRHWNSNNKNVSVFDAKSDTLSVLEAIGAPVHSLQVWKDAPSWFHPGRSGTLKLGSKNPIANFGELHPQILSDFNINGIVAVFEIFLENIPKSRNKGNRSKGKLELSDLMPVNRDFAFVLDRSVEAIKVVKAAQNADKSMIRNVMIFDTYQGAGIDKSKKSIAIDVTIQPIDETLTDKKINEISNKVIAEVEKATGGILRQ